MRRAAVLLICAALLAAACSGGSTKKAAAPGGPTSSSSTDAARPTSTTASPTSQSPTSLPPAATLTWQPCAGNECATLSVPLDYTKPSGDHLGIAMIRHRATGARIGSLLVDPGGPGASGIDTMSYFLDVLTPTVQEHFDIVAFDPRGVGRSSPVRCMDSKNLDAFIALDPLPSTPQKRQQLLEVDKAFTTGCQARSGKILPFVGTADAARDMDQMRAALGDRKLTYFGFSYGTYLGAVYAEEFPTNVRALVLDGAIDPSLDTVESNNAQGAGFDKAFGAFLADCASKSTCTWRPGGDLKTAYNKLVASITAHPLPVGRRQLTAGELFYGVAAPLYDKTDWPILAAALQLASQGDGSTMLQLADSLVERHADGTYANAQEANAAVNCIDKPSPTDPAAYDRAAADVAKTAPEFGPAIAYGGLVCAFWPVPAKGKAEPIKAAGSPPIMVIGTTNDPATPYAGAQALASQLDKGVLVTRVGDGHTGYRSSACVQRYADAYLVDLVVPSPNPTCSS